MSLVTTPRFGIPYMSAGSDPFPGTRALIQSIVTQIEASGAMFGKGAISTRPAASASNLGMFWLSDLGSLAVSDGAVWRSTMGDHIDARDYLTGTIALGDAPGVMPGTAPILTFSSSNFELQTAIDAARKAQLPLYCPAGNYGPYVPGSVNNHNVTIYGDGMHRTVILVAGAALTGTWGYPFFNTSVPATTVSSPNNMTELRDLTVAGVPGFQPPSALVDIIHGNGGFLAERVWFRCSSNSGGAMVGVRVNPLALSGTDGRLAGGVPYRFKDCVFTDDKDSGVSSIGLLIVGDASGGRAVSVENSTFSWIGTGLKVSGQGINNVSVTGSKFSSNAVDVRNESATPITFTGCELDATVSVANTPQAYLNFFGCTIRSQYAALDWGVDAGGTNTVQGSILYSGCTFDKAIGTYVPITVSAPLRFSGASASRYVRVDLVACNGIPDPSGTQSTVAVPDTTKMIHTATGYTITFKARGYMRRDSTTGLPVAILDV